MKNQKTILIPQEYRRLFDDDWREAAVYGGRYSLKSHTVARYLIIRARMDKTRVACFREFQSSIAESSHQLLADLIKLYDLRDFKVTDNSIINTINGSDFIFKGLYQNEQSIKSIEGIDIAWVEEAQTVSKESLEVLTPTIRKPGSKIIYTYNRLLENDPVHERLVIEGRPNTLIINVNYDIAEKYGWLPDVVKNEIEDDRLHRPALYKQKWLGEPYLSPNDTLKEDSLIKCLSPEINEQNDRIIIGLDTGHDLYYVLMNKQGTFYHGYCQSPQEKNEPNYDPYDEIERLLKTYERSILVADQGGDLIGVRKLQQKYKGRVVLCWSNKESKTQNLIQWKDEDGDEKVFIDRNRFIQQCVDEINERRMVFNGKLDDWKPFFKHATNIYRVKEIRGEENDPQYSWSWIWKRKGPDHWWMAYVYARVGLDRYAQDLAQIIKPNQPFAKPGSDYKGDYQGVRFIPGTPWKPNF
jgi:hypothetical protein